MTDDRKEERERYAEKHATFDGSMDRALFHLGMLTPLAGRLLYRRSLASIGIPRRT